MSDVAQAPAFGPDEWARHLLDDCGLPPLPFPVILPKATSVPGQPEPSGAQRWAASGAMALTGWPDGPALLPPVDLATAADGAALAFAALARLVGQDVRLDGAALLGERAALLGYTRRGRITPGGSTRLLRAADGWVALGLRRPDDVDLVPALIGRAVADNSNPWPELADWLLDRSADEVVDRAQLLGLPAATRITGPMGTGPTGTGRMGTGRPWQLIAATDPARSVVSPGSTGTAGTGGGWGRRPLVVDFSTLWAGPLATSLLLLAGVDVIKVESPDRPDGTRSGAAAFHDLLNVGKLSVAARPDDPLARSLVERADLVVTSARPRALEQLGLVPAPGRSWLTITGYDWQGPRRNWVAYGDDAAVAAGLLSGPPDAPVFCADAVADPLTGLHAAVVALAVLIAGRSMHLDVSLHAVAAHLTSNLPRVQDPTYPSEAELVIQAPRARPSRDAAAELGADQDHRLVRGRGA